MSRFGWRRPRWHDPAYWAAVGITIVLVVLQGLVIDRESSWVWLGLAVRVVITWVVISACVRIRIGMTRSLVDGYRQAEQAAADRPSGSSKSEEWAKAGGRVAGRALKRIQR